MTREEAYILFGVDIDRWNSDVEKSILHCIDKIYDDFRSRTCENCNINKRCPIQNGFNMYQKSVMGVVSDVFDGFGCNKFERKTDEKS